MGRATFDLLVEDGFGRGHRAPYLINRHVPSQGFYGGGCVMGRPHRCKGNERKRILGGGYSFAARLVLGKGVLERGSSLILPYRPSRVFFRLPGGNGLGRGHHRRMRECTGLNSGDLQMDFWGGVIIVNRLTLSFIRCNNHAPGRVGLERDHHSRT